MKITFIEFEDEARALSDYIQATGFQQQDLQVIALSLEAQARLRSNGIGFKTTLEYFDNDSHKNCLLKSDSLVQFMRKNLRFDNNPEDIKGYKEWYIQCIRYLINYNLWLIEIISNAIQKENPGRILVFESEESDFTGHFVKNSERYIPSIVHSISGIPITTLKSTFKTHSTNHPSKMKRHNSAGLDLLKKQKTVFAISLAYGLSSVCKKIKKWDNNIKLVYLSEKPRSNLEKLYYKLFKGVDYLLDFDDFHTESYEGLEEDLSTCLEILEENNELFTYKGIDFWHIIKPKISTGISNSTIDLANRSCKLSKVIGELKPNLTLSYSSRHLSYNLGEICRNSGIEGLCISHGTVVPPKNGVEEIVNRNIGEAVILNRYPSIAVQTPWCQKFLDHYPHESEDIVTGPLIFRDDIKKKKDFGTINILHAVTLKTRFSTKFWGVETNDEFISSITSLIEAIDNMDNVRLTIKLHPAYKHTLPPTELRKLIPDKDCFSLSYGKSIYEELAKSDLLVSFSSTTIEEALLNKIPVLLFDKWGRYKHFDATELGKEEFRAYPVYYANSEDIMKKSLPSIVERGLGSFISEKDWLKYSFRGDKKMGFYKYLEKCFGRS